MGNLTKNLLQQIGEEIVEDLLVLGHPIFNSELGMGGSSALASFLGGMNSSGSAASATMNLASWTPLIAEITWDCHCW
jgi:hypothetical protein